MCITNEVCQGKLHQSLFWIQVLILPLLFGTDVVLSYYITKVIQDETGGTAMVATAILKGFMTVLLLLWYLSTVMCAYRFIETGERCRIDSHYIIGCRTKTERLIGSNLRIFVMFGPITMYVITCDIVTYIIYANSTLCELKSWLNGVVLMFIPALCIVFLILLGLGWVCVYFCMWCTTCKEDNPEPVHQEEPTNVFYENQELNIVSVV
jgi:hypothetical protein